jgi:two-component system CheB/CheR fusion protein
VYLKKTGSLRPPFVGPISPPGTEKRDHSEQENRMPYEESGREGDLQKEADHLLLARYAPASVVVDAQMEILSVRGHTSPYLEQAPGRASLNLFRMAREGLDLELRAALSKAKKSGRPVKKAGIQRGEHDHPTEIAVEIIPMKAQASEGCFLILFEDTSVARPDSSASLPQDGVPMARAKRGVKDRRIEHLEQELEARSEEMRSLIEEQEAANEQLQSANEEILSSNEELQSLNEELETSREEIQASNEELLVINQELTLRNTQLQEARTFAEAIVETVREPLLVLDTGLRVQSANRAFYDFFQTAPAQTEQCLLYELGNGQWDIPALRTLIEEILPTNHAFADYEVDHTFPGIGHKTMLLNARRIDERPLLLLAMEDITARKQAEQEQERLLAQREEFMAIASHELKTPVTSLKGYTQVLLARLSRAGDEHSAALLSRMETQINKLISLISELLDLSKMEDGHLAWQQQPFDLDALARDIIEEMAHTTQRHQIRIAHEKQAHVFERFFRVSDPEHASFPGLGLGLYISAEIVKRHRGRIWVESSEGLGSTFFFTVPFAPGPAVGPAQQEGVDPHV